MVIKNQIRSINKKNRINMPHDDVILYSRLITERILKSKWYKNSELLLAYSSIQNEADLSGLIEQAITDGKKVFLPRVSGEEIEFFRIKSIDELNSLEAGSFNILEPNRENVDSYDKHYNCDNNCTILVPGIGFSIKGQRIGFGKGYYDRFLSKYINIYKVGICYEWQITDSFESNEFDVDMDMIITDKREVRI